MTSYPAPICLGCTHFHATGEPLACDAFPGGIPAAILESRADHRQPFTGDQGVRFAPKTPIAAAYAAQRFPTPASPMTDTYPPAVLHYGDAGKALYDDQVAALVSIAVSPDEAHNDVLALWDTLVTTKSLHPIAD